METYDVAVIGGGPAGMMAAITAAEKGSKVILIEKNNELGRKLLMTGNGRCNLTHAEFDVQELISSYGENGRFLYSAFSTFGVGETMEFFENRGLSLKVEEDGRVFPESDDAHDVVNLLRNGLRELKVTILYDSPVKQLEKKGNRITGVVIKRKPGNGEPAEDMEKETLPEPEKPEEKSRFETITADSFIIATGGKSYPATGSTGNGYTWAVDLGHRVVEPTPALVPIRVKEDWVKDLQGVSVSGVRISVRVNENEELNLTGDVMFTHFGLSGPVILNAGSFIGALRKQGKVTVTLDLKPEFSREELGDELLRKFAKQQNRLVKNVLNTMIPPKLVEFLMYTVDMEPGCHVNSITKRERLALRDLMKEIRLTVTGLGGFDTAMVTRGGISLDEVDPRTMRSRIIENLSFAGEVLDLDGPTGGYNLQVCWSTGFIAGSTHPE